MKFGKEFETQMVPEWQQAYMDYNLLKNLLKDIQRFRHRTQPPATTPAGLKRTLTLYRAFSGLVNRHCNVHNPTSPSTPGDIENQPILMNSVRRNSSESYQTTFLMIAEEGGEFEFDYFRRLDEELNKVDKFYNAKVEEVIKEAEMLNKQMEALIAFRIKVENPQGWFDRSMEMTRFASDIAASTAVLAASTPRSARASRKFSMAVDMIEEGGSRSHGEEQSDESGDDHREENKKSCNSSSQTDQVNLKVQVEKPKETKLAPLEVLNHVQFNNTLETPRSTIKGVLNVPMHTQLTFNKENLTKVEGQLKRAFIEFYQKLRLLKNFSFLNTLAFSKIMKKYDKITGRNASKSYMKTVDNSNLGSSDEVTKLVDRVEATFIKHFSNSNRRKGMAILRPKQKKERHWITFSTGFFAGCTAALVVALVLFVHARKIMDETGSTKYMETMFPLYSLFGFIVLHILMYAINIYYWRLYRANYSFIFGFKKGTELSHREVLLIAFVIASVGLGSVLSNLDMEMDPKTKDFKAWTEIIPLILVVSVIVILILPFNVICRSSRFFFLTCLFHCFCAPLYKVVFPDFFLADQLTSQVQAIRSLEFYICYYGWGDYKKRENTCRTSDVYNTFFYLVAVLPYLVRLLQCLRRLLEEKDPMQGYNGVKYFLTIAAVSFRTAYSLNKASISWKVVASVTSACAAIVGTYWDLVIDWGLLQRQSKNRWLRDRLLVPHKSVYFGAIVMNILLRFAWLQTVLDFQVSFLHRESLITIVASLEIVRRGIWNFFRLENEHLNNVGKYRAFKSVPLPFHYDEDGDRDD
ncbi:hypothetical protein FNV43_RR26233 [Rhamnella rubrinervis]|uniref:Phosphate transporter PHO1 homolog 3-like n=1 Tax=Rhamnella rubrinervis TaxID=2594499 RepID=A0A8K0GJF6_9ROSA|nr:hypothetical protein FNV43_RR26233 [Rhamnella rubrinervis]